MKPRGPLMIEHRLIEKMIAVISMELQEIKRKTAVDTLFVDSIIDFIRIYADRTHHGKEEDILFRELSSRDIKDKDKKAMQELMDEHRMSREAVQEISRANMQYMHGELKSIDTITEKMEFLVSI